MSSIREGTTTTLQTPYNNDTWSCPFNVGYLNVGRRRLVGSLAEVIVLVLRYRPDILFLGDLVTSRAHIGRLKKQIERNLKDEWFMITNINASSGSPVGVGAIIHCSLAKYITDCTIQPPDGLDQKEWEKAVSGRILRLKVSRPGVPCTWQFTGVYQHVSSSVNRLARAQVRNTLQESLIMARRDGHRVLILGDFNAAPPKGRWGYATGSATVREDRTMENWVRDTNLTEVFQGGKPRPTWKPSEGP
jgi:hypothetical protein